MLSLSTAQQIKQAGLPWTPALHDVFAIPDRGFEDRAFVISDVFVNLEWLHGQLAITFHGSAEWALDHLMVADLVWLPTEAQLRQELETRLAAQGQPELRLTHTPDGYVCEFQAGDTWLCFEASDASEAYAAALLHVLVTDR
jgi:hypothetical protein